MFLAIRWYAGLPPLIVGGIPLIAGLVLSAVEAAGWIFCGNYGVALPVLPVVAWAIAGWWTDRK